jgi:hypothetical protein
MMKILPKVKKKKKTHTHTEWIAAAISDYSIRAVLVDMGLMPSFVISFSCSEANDELKFTDSLGGGGKGSRIGCTNNNNNFVTNQQLEFRV